MPTLSTLRLFLEHPKQNAGSLVVLDWLNDPQLMRYSENRRQKHTLESQREYLKQFDQRNNFYWNIISIEHDRLIGTITAFVDPIHGFADLGVLIGRDRQHGFGIEAWNRVTAFLFEHGVARKIEAGMMSNNEAMIRLCKRANMRYEGERHGHFLDGGNSVGLTLYGRQA
jgi:RimJ/RimL family protein N-acetyltransferase